MNRTLIPILAITLAVVVTEWNNRGLLQPAVEPAVSVNVSQPNSHPKEKATSTNPERPTQATPAASDIKIPEPRQEPASRKNLARSSRIEKELDEMARETIQLGDDLVDNAEHPMAIDLASVLGIPQAKWAIIQNKEAQLRRRLAAADRDGATGTRRLLVADYRSWLKEYVGADKYDQFREYSGNDVAQFEIEK